MTKATFRSIAAIIGVIFLGVILSYCGEEEDSGNVPVSVTFSIPAAAKSSAAPAFKSITVPPNVLSVIINISASDISTINDTFNVSPGSTVTKIYNVPPGSARIFAARAYSGPSGTGFLLYEGASRQVDLEAGVLTTVLIPMAAGLTGIFVDVNTGDDGAGDGSPTNPYRTITFALSATVGDEPVNVAAGFYIYTSSGETFPLQLKTGTALKCSGTGHTTVIDATDSYSDAILGAAGATIEGCNVVASEGGIAISDEGNQITINDNIIEAVPGTYDNRGIYLTADSTVSNSIVRFFSKGEGWGEGIMVEGSSPSISGSTIISNDRGIYVGFGSAAPLINNNILSCNSSRDLESYSDADIDATNNQWDHSPPQEEVGNCIIAGSDICNFGAGFIDYSGYSLAPSPCTP